jgi:hypothetical protein
LPPRLDQCALNYLHKFFEDLRGDILAGTYWFNTAPDEIKQAVEQFNILIHKLESEIRTQEKHPTLVVTFKDSVRIELTDQDCDYFTYQWTQGTVYINYCQVGKTIIDAFKDNDNLTESIRPQTHYSADFMIKFGPSTPRWLYYIRQIFLKCWITKKKLPFKNLNLGMIPVADLATSVDSNVLRKFDKVKKIICIK